MGNQHTGPPQWSFEKKGTLTTRSVAFPDEVSQAIEAVYSSDTLEHIHKIKAKDSDGVVHEYLVDFLKFEVGNPPLPLTRSPPAFPPCLRNTQSKYWAVYEKAGQKGGNSQPAAGSPYDEDNEPDPKDQHAKQKPKSNPNQKFDDLEILELARFKLEDRAIIVSKGDLTLATTQVVVNAANGNLNHGGGIAKAISNRAGPELDKESRQYTKKHGTIPVGDVGVTGPGKMSCQYVIHAVGPRWVTKDIFHPKTDNPPVELHNCIYNTLVKADSLKVQTISIPSISTGIFGGQIDPCSWLILLAILQYFNDHPDSGIEAIHLVSWDDERADSFAHYTKELCDLLASQ